MSAKIIAVVTRSRTMSGHRGGKTLTLPRDEAERMIRMGWADPAPEPGAQKDAIDRISRPAGRE
jgi:hypothetical protein